MIGMMHVLENIYRIDRMTIGEPTDVKVNMGKSSAVITWKPPADTTGLTGYIITGTSSNGGTTKTLTITGATSATTSATVTSLTTGKKYTFSIVSVASGTQSAPTKNTESATAQTIAHTSTIQTNMISGADYSAFVKGITTVNFQNQYIPPAPLAYTRFTSQADYLAYKKASINLSALG